MKILYNCLLKGLICLCLLSLVQDAWAQIPQQINYQGAVRDKSGKPIVNQLISVRLSILNGGPNAASEYAEVRQVTTNGVGLYAIAIGSTVGATQVKGEFSQINWGLGSKFLKVEIDVEGDNNFVLAGTTPLISVPYALYAKYAENGPVGPAGPAGANGSTILSGTTDPQPGQGNPGDYYFNTTTYTLYGPQNLDGTWPQGTVLLQGPAGPVGPPGANGLSAYEVWESLPANDGKTITQFLEGLKGAQGPIGPAGANGLSAFEIWQQIPGNENATIEQYLEGLKGAQGPIGPAGANGLSAFEIWQQIPGNENATIEQYLDALKGADGLSIISATISPSSGNLILTLSDNTTIVAGKVIGPQGPTGPQGPIGATGIQGPAGPIGDTGVGISETKVVAGNLMLTLTDGSVLNAGPVVGPAGTSVLSATINEVGHLILTFSNGSTSDAGFAIGSTGPPGAPGTNGINCWDLNGNGMNDQGEDINNDGQFNTQDCLASGTGTTNLTNGHIFVGNSTNIATDVAMSGDATISNTGALTIANDAVTLSKMANGTPNQIYTTNATGEPTLADFNGIGWSIYGNNSTVDGTHFMGTIDDRPLNFRINNEKSGRVTREVVGTQSRGETSLGYRAGINATGAIRNTLIGIRAGEALTVNSHRNTLIGALAGYQMTGSAGLNTGIGQLVFQNFTTGANNTAIGDTAGAGLVNGSSSLFVGQGAGLVPSGDGDGYFIVGNQASASPGLTNASALGNNAKVSVSNSLVLGGTSGSAVNVGINTTAPEARLHVNDGHLFFPQTTKPTISISNFNGITGASIADNSSDTRGRINISGTTSTFGGAFSVVAVVDYLPKGANAFSVITITPGNTAAAACEYLVTPTATGFFLHFRGRTAVVTNPVFYYMTMD